MSRPLTFNLSFKFAGGLRKTIFFARVCFGQSRSLISVPNERAYATSY